MTECDKPLRICLLSYRSAPHCGGQGVYLRYLAGGLERLGHRVDIVLGPPGPLPGNRFHQVYLPGLNLYNPDQLFRTPRMNELIDPINFIEWCGVASMGFPEPRTFGIRAHRLLRRRRTRYDVIHDNQGLSHGIGRLGRLFPLVTTIHHPITIDRQAAVRNAPTFFKKAQQLRWYSFVHMQKRVSRRLKNIITVSKQSKRDIVDDYRVPADRIHIVPNGIDTSVFAPKSGVVRDPDSVITVTSADIPLKGLVFLIQAVARIRRYRRIRLTVVGSVPENGSAARLIRQSGNGGAVTFTGRIDQPALVDLYARAAVAVVPSLYEGFGLPAGEAMACGLPVVCTTGGALPEVVGNAGVLVPPGDAAALEKALVRLLDHRDHAGRIGALGRERIRRHFTWEQAAAGTVAVYRRAINDYGGF